MPFLVVSRNGETLLRYPLDRERVLVGRDADCDLPLDDTTISRHHFELQWDGTNYNITDHSRNGTYIDGERVSDTVPIDHGQRISIGNYHLELSNNAGEPEVTTVIREHKPTLILKYEPTAKALTLERIALNVKLANGEQFTQVVDHLPISFGGAPQNSIALPKDPYISRHHCRIEASPAGITLRDMGSRNGTWWANNNIQTKLLPERGSFHIGKTAIAYHVQVIEEKVKPAQQQRCGELLGCSPAMKEIFALVTRVAPSDATVLITGESGTGKELLARALHAGSGRANKPFIAINCGAIPATIIESELFGHERGAFTGATTQHKGVFEQAHGGTLFLDEIGEMPRELQTRLLRVLETKTIRRVGGTSDMPVDCRIVAATNRDLGTLIAKKAFREDLYYRLYIVPMLIPPLRDRPQDIALLLRHYMQSMRPSSGKAVHMTPEAEQRLLKHPWHGNVRELRHTVERAIITAHDAIIDLKDLQFTPNDALAFQEDVTPSPTGYALKEREKESIADALRVHQGNVSQTAKSLGIARSTLMLKVKKWKINLTQIRND